MIIIILVMTVNPIQVASRFLNSTPLDPKIILKLHLDQEKTLNHRSVLSELASEYTYEHTVKEMLIECSLNSLVHIIDQLESAKNFVSAKRVQ